MFLQWLFLVVLFSALLPLFCEDASIHYDYRIQSMIHTTNWIERLNRDYKRTVRMRGSLPNSESVILLLGHVAMTRKAYQRKIPLLNYESEKFNWSE